MTNRALNHEYAAVTATRRTGFKRKHCWRSPLFQGAIRYTEGYSSVLLMAVIISKVTNAINMKNSFLITQLTLGLSSTRFNHHTARINKRSTLAWLCGGAQYNNQPIYRLSDWTAGYCEIQFMSTEGCTEQW